MVTFGLNTASLLGLIYIILGIVYLVWVTSVLVKRRNSGHELSSLLYIVQAFIFPPVMAFCGLIVLTQGWRLDPILQFQQMLTSLLLIYISIKDILIYRNRR